MARGQKDEWIKEIISLIKEDTDIADISDCVYNGVSDLISEIEDRVNDIKATLNDHDSLQALSMLDDLSDDLY